MSCLDLVLTQRVTLGQVPPATVGSTASTINGKVYVIAGRLASTRELTNDVYVLDLASELWTRISVHGSSVPKTRYFHSANVFRNSIVIYGGMTSGAAGPESTTVLGDLAIFDTQTLSWTLCATSTPDLQPSPRYAQLSAVLHGKLFIIGGQDISNAYIEDAAIFDLERMLWLGVRPIGKPCGAYRSLAVCKPRREGAEYAPDAEAELRNADTTELVSPTSPSPSGASFEHAAKIPSHMAGSSELHRFSTLGSRAADSLQSRSEQSQHESTSRSTKNEATAKDDVLGSIYVYSNYNFTSVLREFFILQVRSDNTFFIEDRSQDIRGEIMPPGLRFPSGSLVGDHIVFSGTYLTNTNQSFSLWSLNLKDLVWQVLDLGNGLRVGSWNKTLFCKDKERLLVLGDHDRSLVDDYNHRQTNFRHITLIDLEAFEILCPMPPTVSPLARQVGLLSLSDPVFSDMEIYTEEDTVIPVSSKILSMKWPGFYETMRTAMNATRPHSQISGRGSWNMASDDRRSESVVSTQTQASIASSFLNHATTRPRCLYVPRAHIVVYAFVHFLYTGNLPEAIEDGTTFLCSLMTFVAGLDPSSTNTEFQRLLKCCRHRLHDLLAFHNAAMIYETCALSAQYSLQVRALKLMVKSRRASDQPALSHLNSPHATGTTGN